MGVYPARALDRAMKLQEVILRAVDGKITWMQAAEIIGVSDRTMRRWRRRYEKHGYDGLYDRRWKRPSPKKIPIKTMEQILRLYREKYFDFHVKHFVEKLHSEHGMDLSYTWVKTALQTAGLVVRHSRRGKHRKKRPRRPLPGMLLHIDASTHKWLGGESHQDLIVVMDDATNEVYYARLVQQESTETMMAALRHVIGKHGLFCSLYSDRARHFAFTRKAGQEVDRAVETQIGRALRQLGIEMILAYSPQARGRSERLFGTWQGRLPQELRHRGIVTMDAANAFLLKHWIEFHNQTFTVRPAEQGTAFMASNGADLDKVFSRQEERMVDNDNTIMIDKRVFQIPQQTFRFSLARCRVLVCRHLDRSLSIYYGPHLLAQYLENGTLVEDSNKTKERKNQKRKKAAA